MKKVCIFLIVIFLFACGGKKSKKETSLDCLYTTQAFKVLDEIRILYQNKDNEEIKKYSTEEAYKEIISSIKPFDKVELEFNPVLVEIDKDNLRVYVSWNGKWSYHGKDYEERGLASFLLKGDPPKLVRIIRDNPFRFPQIP